MPQIRLDELHPSDLRPVADAVRGLARTARALEDAAQAATRILYETFVDGAGAPACALVRVYKTHPFAALEAELQEFARAIVGGDPSAEMRCLTLLGTAGDLEQWNSRHESVEHKAIPLPSADFVERLPMVAQLVTQLGVGIDTVVHPPEEPIVHSQRTYGVFHVAEAAESPFLPAQDFIAAHGIRSAVGFGGILLSGDFYAAVLFSKVPLDEGAARTLKILALPLRVALTPMIGRPVFAA